MMLYTTQKFFEHGNKAGRLLTYLARPDSVPTSIPCIQLSTSLGGTASHEVLDAFLSFYINLYASTIQYSDEQSFGLGIPPFL